MLMCRYTHKHVHSHQLAKILLLTYNLTEICVKMERGLPAGCGGSRSSVFHRQIYSPALFWTLVCCLLQNHFLEYIYWADIFDNKIANKWLKYFYMINSILEMPEIQVLPQLSKIIIGKCNVSLVHVHFKEQKWHEKSDEQLF